jgi:hypothetical protein
MKTFTILPLILFWAGCNKNHTPAPIPEKDTTTLTSQTISVRVALTHSRDTTVQAPDTTSLFGTTDTVHGVIHSEHARQGTALVGRWYYLKTGQKIAENSTVLNAGTNLTHFDLMNEMPWPQGQYKLLVLIDSAIKDSAEFTVANNK